MVNNICSLKIVLFLFFVTSCEQDKKILFNNNNYEVTNLDGNWELVKTGIIEDKMDNLFEVNKNNFNYKKLSIDTEKMIFHLRSYPFNNPREYGSKIRIAQDSIRIMSGTTVNNEIKLLTKEIIIFKLSSDFNYLRLMNANNKSVMIFSKL